MRIKALDETAQLQNHYQLDRIGSPIVWTSREQASAFVADNIDALLFDCDGVIYRGKDPSPGAQAVMKALMVDQGKKCFFVTNNAGASREQLRGKLAAMLDCELLLDQIISSSYSSAQYLKKSIPKGGKVHVIGTEGLVQEISQTGFRVSGGPCDGHPSSMSRDELAEYELPQHPVDAVVVGLDTGFNYRKLCIANVILQNNPNALFVSTNQDAFDLVGRDARHLPGNGALVRALEHCSQRRAIDVGKPSKVLADLITELHDLDPSRTMMVGDRLDTDIRFGNDSGMVSLLVMTGCTTADSLIKLGGEGTEEMPLPQVIAPYIGMLA